MQPVPARRADRIDNDERDVIFVALTDENGGGMVMPVTPMNGNGGNGGFGFGNDGGWWILLLFLLLGNNGWGNGGNGNGLYPWMNQSQQVNDGFRDQMLASSINGIQASVTNGFAGVSNGFAQAEIADNARQIANLQQGYAQQTAMMQGFSGLQAQLAQCCCDNRAGIADLRYTVATEACADRAAVNDALRDVIASQTASTQRILDQLCADKIEAKNTEIANLRQQLNMAQLAASQSAQTATIQAGQRALANEVEQYVLPTPRPAYIVQNPNCCQPNFGCGCGA